MNRRRSIVDYALPVAALAILLLSMMPAVAQAPDKVTVTPLAQCDGGKCVMSEADYKTLQKFHADRVDSIMAARDLIDALQQQNAALMHMIARDAGHCRRGRDI